MDFYKTILSEGWPSLILVFAIFAIVRLLPRLVYEIELRRLPLVGEEHSRSKRVKNYFFSAATVYQEGYEKFKGVLHRITTLSGQLPPTVNVFPIIDWKIGDHIIIPSRYLDELRQLPESDLDVLHTFKDTLENDYTGVFPERSRTIIVNNAVKSDLTRALPRLTGLLSEEVERTVRSEFPPCDEWTAVKVTEPLHNIVAIVSGLIFLGPDLCRRPEYIRAAVNYTVDITAAVFRLKAWPWWTRPFVSRILPELVRLGDHRKDMKAFLEPVIYERRRMKLAGDRLPDDALQWILEKAEAAGITSIADLANMQLLLTMAAIHTTTLTTTRIQRHARISAVKSTVFWLVAHLTTEGGFVNKFDPYRFYKLRTTDIPDPIGYKSREQYQFVSVTKESMSFGLGRHACPGRFFAANEIKLILARILLEYDIKMPDGIETPYSNFSVGVTNGTDPTKEILLRNLHQVPREKVHLQFQKWAEEYGPVYSLILGTKVLVVLSSDQAVKDLLDKRSGIYSSRPDILNVKAARTYVPYQDLENKAMLVGFLEQPALFMDHIRRYTNSLSTQMMFGFRTTSLDDPKLKQLYHPCFCVDLVRAQEQEGFSDEMAAYVSGSLLEAGSDTTSSTLIGFVQALLCFPEVVKLAQAELDSVCGDRLPDLNDLPNLPYIRGCMKESLRWMPTVPLGVNHAVIRDDEYMGYKIPKGAGVMWNVWAIGHDPKRHPDPQRFDPARWAHDSQTSAEAANNPDATKRDHFVFGAGRRLCQGMHIADRSLFLAISRLLWAFDFRRPVDETTGQEIVPDMEELTEGLFVAPKPFRAHIVPRSEYKAQRVREEWSKMTELLDSELQWKDVPEGVIWRDYEPIGTQK
ncbi:hypothetical protein DL767_005601 [Monosporascus sp. MG133]|nr:hypothetical protein DL767_005601 [Monosporascus sp. MG133]